MSYVNGDSIWGIFSRSNEDIVLILEALGNIRRLQILTFTLKGSSTFDKLQKVTGLGKTALAHHLSILVKSGVLKHTGKGQYALSVDGVELLTAIGTAYMASKRRREFVATKRADYIQRLYAKQERYATEELKVNITKLEPMHVASVRVISETPAHDSWEKMRAWAAPKGLLEDLDKHPVFGFNNPDPVPNKKEYGYEVWIRIEPDIKPEGEIQVKDFAGGLYAVTTCRVQDDPGEYIPKTWKRLFEWVKSSKYKFGTHQWLEKVHDPGASEQELILDLYCPIGKKKVG